MVLEVKPRSLLQFPHLLLIGFFVIPFSNPPLCPLWLSSCFFPLSFISHFAFLYSFFLSWPIFGLNSIFSLFFLIFFVLLSLLSFSSSSPMSHSFMPFLYILKIWLCFPFWHHGFSLHSSSSRLPFLLSVFLIFSSSCLSCSAAASFLVPMAAVC